MLQKKIFLQARYFGKSVTIALLAGSLVGVMLSLVEVGFAFAIQIFLRRAGILSATEVLPGDWFAFLYSLGWIPSMLFLMGLGVLRSVSQALREYFSGGAVDRFIAYYREMIVHWSFSGDAKDLGEASSLFTERTQRAAVGVGSVGRSLSLLVTGGVLFLSLMLISVQITLVATGLIAIVYFALRTVDRSIARIGSELVREWNETSNRFLRSIKNLFLITIYGTKVREEARSIAGVRNYLRHSLSFYWLIGVKAAVPQVSGILVLCGVVYWSQTTKQLTGPAILSYFYLFVRMVQALSDLASSLAQYQLNEPQIAALIDWRKSLRSTPTAPVKSSSTDVIPPRIQSLGFSAQSLSFRYPGATRYALENVNFDLQHGEALVIVGASGSGKSTLLSLLLGVLSPTEGAVTYLDAAGAPTSVTAGELYTRLGYVGPESFLFAGTLRENLIYGLNFVPSDAELAEALQLAEGDFVYQMPLGLESRVTDQGEGISAGQKQRLALARALLRQPVALILDEATANLDTGTEDRLLQTFWKLKGQITLVIVTHREKLVSIGDRVLHFSGSTS